MLFTGHYTTNKLSVISSGNIIEYFAPNLGKAVSKLQYYIRLKITILSLYYKISITSFTIDNFRKSEYYN